MDHMQFAVSHAAQPRDQLPARGGSDNEADRVVDAECLTDPRVLLSLVRLRYYARDVGERKFVRHQQHGKRMFRRRRHQTGGELGRVDPLVSLLADE